MAYECTKDCVEDLERHGHLVRVKEEVDGHLEMALIQRRVYAAGGKAVLFEHWQPEIKNGWDPKGPKSNNFTFNQSVEL